jgi:mercuric ion transport protein
MNERGAMTHGLRSQMNVPNPNPTAYQEKATRSQATQARRGFYAALTGTVAVALCCFTPVLVLALAALGLSAVTRYLDYVLLPALAVLMILAIISYRRWRRLPASKIGLGPRKES